jgi:CHAT domain-containing protein
MITCSKVEAEYLNSVAESLGKRGKLLSNSSIRKYLESDPILREYSMILLSGHGNLMKNPFETHILENEQSISVADVLSRALSALLVILSTCWSGVMKNTANNLFLGMPGAFLYSGSKAVIGAMYEIPEDSACLLFIYFWHKLKKKLQKYTADRSLKRRNLQNILACCLHKASRKLRDSTRGQHLEFIAREALSVEKKQSLMEYVNRAKVPVKKAEEEEDEGEEILLWGENKKLEQHKYDKKHLDEIPYSSPKDWGSYILFTMFEEYSAAPTSFFSRLFS